jgi:ArsR family transcriptional regulator
MPSSFASLDVTATSRMFKALGDETRLKIVALLSHGELCVCHVEEALGLSQPNASRHLGILKNAGIVESRRAANWVYYRLAPQADELRRRQLRALIAEYQEHDSLRKEVERLVKSEGPRAAS